MDDNLILYINIFMDDNLILYINIFMDDKIRCALVNTLFFSLITLPLSDLQREKVYSRVIVS